MRTIPRFLACVLLSLAGLAAQAADSPEMADDFAWFSSLSFPDVKGLTFVHYLDGWSTTGGEKEMQSHWSYGWLLADAPNTITIRTLNFQSEEFPKSGKSRWEEHHFEPADLRQYAEEQLKPSDDGLPKHRGLQSGPGFPQHTQLFVLAWMCAQQGLDDLAGKLYAVAAQSKDLAQALPHTNQGAGSDKTSPFRPQLESDLGTFEIWNVILDFGDLKVTRKQLLPRLQALPQRFPHCNHLKLAANLAAQLEKMIAEDDAHPAISGKEIAKLPPGEQAKEWVFRLRDANAHQYSQPGSVDSFMDFEDPAQANQSAVHKLAALGDAAVPALIEALGDPRPTRSVGYDRDFFFSHHVLSVGDAALQIIQKIAGRNFYRSGSIQGTMARDGMTDPVRAAVQAWWKNRQIKGPMVDLSETTARGDYNSVQAGRKLLEDFPKDAAKPIFAGAAAAATDDTRCELIKLATQSKDAGVPDFLLREVRDETSIGVRAEAAGRLARFGRLEGIQILAKVWRTALPEERSSGDSFPDSSPREKLLAVLTLADSPDGFRALADGLRNRTSACRHQVLEALRSDWQTYLHISLDVPPGSQAPITGFSETTRAAIEDLLGGELEDDVSAHWSTNLGGKPGATPIDLRLCDLAAVILAQRWPEKYAFDPAAPFDTRERQRLILLNTFRGTHGLPALPLPEPRPRVAPEDEDKIAAVDFAGGAGLKAPEPVFAWLRGAKGRKVDLAFFQELRTAFFDACAGRSPAPDHGCIITALRGNDHTGITLIVSPADRTPSEKEEQREWQICVYGTLDGKDRLSSDEIRIFDPPPRRAASPPVEPVFEKIRGAVPDQPFQLTIEIAPVRIAEDDAI